jgi:hypothetical protein
LRFCCHRRLYRRVRAPCPECIREPAAATIASGSACQTTGLG